MGGGIVEAGKVEAKKKSKSNSEVIIKNKRKVIYSIKRAIWVARAQQFAVKDKNEDTLRDRQREPTSVSEIHGTDDCLIWSDFRFSYSPRSLADLSSSCDGCRVFFCPMPVCSRCALHALFLHRQPDHFEMWLTRVLIWALAVLMLQRSSAHFSPEQMESSVVCILRAIVDIYVIELESLFFFLVRGCVCLVPITPEVDNSRGFFLRSYCKQTQIIHFDQQTWQQSSSVQRNTLWVFNLRLPSCLFNAVSMPVLNASRLGRLLIFKIVNSSWVLQRQYMFAILFRTWRDSNGETRRKTTSAKSTRTAFEKWQFDDE